MEAGLSTTWLFQVARLTMTAPKPDFAHLLDLDRQERLGTITSQIQNCWGTDGRTRQSGQG
jgi:hypothetical protein